MRRKKFPTSVRGLATGGLMREMAKHWLKHNLISFLTIRRMQREDLCKSCNPLQNICQQLSSWMILAADNQEAYSGRQFRKLTTKTSAASGNWRIIQPAPEMRGNNMWLLLFSNLIAVPLCRYLISAR